MTSKTSVYDDIVVHLLRERRYQDEKWGGPDHDDDHSAADFVGFIREYAAGKSDRAAKYAIGVRMVKCGALALAAVERIDRETRPRDQVDQLSIVDEATSTMTIADEITPKSFGSSLVIGLLNYTGTGNEPPKMHRDSMLCVIAYCVRVLTMLSEVGQWPASTAASTS